MQLVDFISLPFDTADNTIIDVVYTDGGYAGVIGSHMSVDARCNALAGYLDREILSVGIQDAGYVVVTID